jgi:hypothetical protein
MTKSVFELPTTKMFGLVDMKGCSSRHETMNEVKDQEWFGWVTVHAPGLTSTVQLTRWLQPTMTLRQS